MFAKALRVALGAILVVVAALVGYLWIAPPNLLKVGTNYAAKIVCSNVFLAGRDAQEVLALDVQAPGHPLLKQVSVSVDESAGQVTARVFGFAAPAVSQYRPGLGCTNLHDATLSPASLPMLAAPGEALWPQGNAVTLSQDPKLVQAMTDPALLGEGYRAALVVHRGQIIAESYADGVPPRRVCDLRPAWARRLCGRIFEFPRAPRSAVPPRAIHPAAGFPCEVVSSNLAPATSVTDPPEAYCRPDNHGGAVNIGGVLLVPLTEPGQHHSVSFPMKAS